MLVTRVVDGDTFETEGGRTVQVLAIDACEPGTYGGDGGGGDIDWPTPGDQGLPDGLLTGGYCATKWWC